ncbi:hypothetical protein WJX73_003331 [Symbiochloris irregularis]|uniref:DNA polymerase epsilon subunit n=1 Tax=Symbiochloris irregularis TaxID=706552 RepID=A0AAW1PUN2_9CHLO
MASLRVKQAIQSEFSNQGLALDKDALECLREHVEEVQKQSNGSIDVDASIQQLLDALDGGVNAKVSGAVAAKLVARVAGGNCRTSDQIQVISAFAVPCIKFDPSRRAFYQVSGARTLHGSALDKRAVYLERFLLLQQRISRNPQFNRPVFGGMLSEGRHMVELTDIKAMLGVTGQRRVIMGCITQPQVGQYALMDPSGTLPLNLSQARTTSGFYTENCIVMAEGEVEPDGRFKATALGFPPIESRQDSIAAAKGLDFFGGTPVGMEDVSTTLEWEDAHEQDRIVVLSDLHLDKPETLDRLETVLEGFEGLDDPPGLFILCGNFVSPSSAAIDVLALKAHFTSLAHLLLSFSGLLKTSKFVFVPGPADAGPGCMLPRPALPQCITSELRRLIPSAVFTSNPTRIRWGSQTVVVFRGNLASRMRALSLIAPASETSDPSIQFAHVCATIMQQSHLCPLPLEAQPVYWQYDSALHLYPLPDALILADSAPMASHTNHGCACLNPGSASAGTFAAYMPGAREVELCDIPDRDDE